MKDERTPSKKKRENLNPEEHHELERSDEEMDGGSIDLDDEELDEGESSEEPEAGGQIMNMES